jgi:hypothetical protein
MNKYDQAIWEVHTVLNNLGISYAVIGGVAVQYWGEPRLTQDIDLTVSAPLEGLDGFVSQILKHFSPRLENALDFALKNRVILVETSNGHPLDIALGLPGYEDKVIERVAQIELEPGKRINICSAEDLIVYKAAAGRPQDIRDIEGIVYRQGVSLDADYIRKWLKEISDVTGDSGLIELFERPWQEVAGKP